MIAGAVIFAVLLGGFVYCLLPKQMRRITRAAAALCFAVLVSAIFANTLEAYGKPKPVWTEWRVLEGADVVSYTLVEGQAIYLWLALPESVEPRAYALPWSTGTARALMEAGEKAKQEGSPGVKVGSGLMYEPSLEDREPMFYPAPVEALPPKDAQ